MGVKEEANIAGHVEKVAAPAAWRWGTRAEPDPCGRRRRASRWVGYRWGWWRWWWRLPWRWRWGGACRGGWRRRAVVWLRGFPSCGWIKAGLVGVYTACPRLAVLRQRPPGSIVCRETIVLEPKEQVARKGDAHVGVGGVAAGGDGG